MSVNQDEVLAFYADVSMLSRKNKPLFLEKLEEKRDSYKMPASALSADAFDHWDQNVRPLGSAWHWVWCIASSATLSMSKNIPTEVWDEAYSMLIEALSAQTKGMDEARDAHNGVSRDEP